MLNNEKTLTEDQVINKYETEFSQYCLDVLDVTHGDAYIRLMEDGKTFWDWLGEYYPEELEALENNDRQMVRGSGIVYDPPMSETDEYLLKKEREEEHKSYDY